MGAAQRTSRHVGWGNLLEAPFHPLLGAAFPVLSLFAANVDQVTADVIWRSLTVTVLGAGTLVLALRLALGDWQWSAILGSLALILFLSYGQVYISMRSLVGVDGWLARHRCLAPIMLMIFAASSIGLRKLRSYQSSVTRIANLIALAAVIMPLSQVALYRLKHSLVEPALGAETEARLQIPPGEPVRDVYYIILDAYSRDDYLAEVFGHSNRDFLQKLEDLGFYVARCSQSNYTATDLSLSSSLNMDYLQQISEYYRSPEAEKLGLDRLIKDSQVRRNLEMLGYSVIAFETGFFYTQLEDANYFLGPPKEGTVSELFSLRGINGFEALLIQASGARLLIDAASKTGALTQLLPDLDRPRSIYRDRTLYVLAQLESGRVPAIRGPKFVFAHIVSPHFPYVIGRDGEFVDVEKDSSDPDGYIDQLVYLNMRLIPILTQLIEDSSPEPIVILQGDHGMRGIPEERVAILNAYYLPGAGGSMLYPSVSPVNSFRVIFDHYFGGDYGLLEDRSFYSVDEHPFDFTEVQNSREGCAE